jgi:hypothetical protein
MTGMMRPGGYVEPLSILNPPITDIFNDPRVTSDGLLKMITDHDEKFMQRMTEYSSRLKPEDMKLFDAMVFAHIQHHLHLTSLSTKLMARQVDLGYVTTQLNRTVERLTKWLIGLTVILGILALPLAIEVILKWLK